LKKMNPNLLIAVAYADGGKLDFQNFQEIAQTQINEDEI